jgi:hypothetical protein
MPGKPEKWITGQPLAVGDDASVDLVHVGD